MEHTVTHQASALNFMDKPLQMEKKGPDQETDHKCIIFICSI